MLSHLIVNSGSGFPVETSVVSESLMSVQAYTDNALARSSFLIPSLFSNILDRVGEWSEVLAERSTDKLIQLCRMNQNPPEGFLIQSILGGQKTWVQTLLDCGSSLNEKIGFVTPSLAWAVRYPNAPLPYPLISTAFEKEFLETKLLSHIFEIDGNVVIKDKVIPLEGFEPGYFWKRIIDITEQLGDRNQTLSQINSFDLFKDAVLSRCNDSVNFNDSPIHVIESGYVGDMENSAHVTSIVLSEHYMAEVDEGVSVYRYHSDFLITNLKNILSPFSFLNKKTYDSILLKLRTITDASLLPKLSHIQDRPFKQIVSNCAWKSIESSLFAVRLLGLLELFHSDGRVMAKEIAQECYLDENQDDQACEDLARTYVEELIEGYGAQAVPELLQDHRDLIEKIQDLALENYLLYREILNDKDKNEIPVNWDFMMKIKNQMDKLRSSYSQSLTM